MLRSPVAEDEVITVAKLEGEHGAIVQFGEVLVLGGDTVSFGNPTVAGASVAGEVIEQGRGPKVIAFKKRRRKNSRRKRGHRQDFTKVRITEILTDGKGPGPKKEAKPRAKKPAAEAPPSDAGDAAEAAAP